MMVTLILLFRIDWQIAVLCIVYSLVCFILALHINPYVNKLEHISRQTIASSSNILLETIQAIPIIRVFLITSVFEGHYRLRCETIRKMRVRSRIMAGVGYGIIDFFVLSSPAIGFILSIWLLCRGEMTLDNAVYVASLMTLAADAMMRFSTFILWSQPALVAVERIFEVLDEPCERLDRSDIIDKPNKLYHESLRFENVSLVYPDGTIALNNINLVIQNGEKLALVGESGSGKTSLAHIIASLYEPSKGSILFYGSDISKLNLDDVRKFIAFVPQESVLFEGSIYENIAFGMTCVSRESVYQAAKNVGLEEFILSLPQGYNTSVGERGTQLSGGQRQRIAIARALIKNAPLLIFDEASSSLDAETELQIQQCIDRLTGHTVVIVAHKVSTIQSADRILILEQGAIVEEGTHATLTLNSERYAKLSKQK